MTQRVQKITERGTLVTEYVDHCYAGHPDGILTIVLEDSVLGGIIELIDYLEGSK